LTINTYNKTATQEEKIEAAKLIFDTYHNKGGKFEVIIHRTSSSNLSWKYSVRLWYVTNSGLVDNLYLNYSLSLLGFGNLTKEGYLKGNGVGIERSFQVMYQLGNALANYDFISSDLSSDRQGYQLERYILSC
jgi:hypothetical protein